MKSGTAEEHRECTHVNVPGPLNLHFRVHLNLEEEEEESGRFGGRLFAHRNERERERERQREKGLASHEKQTSH